jgi:hypothetical protein
MQLASRTTASRFFVRASNGSYSKYPMSGDGRRLSFWGITSKLPLGQSAYFALVSLRLGRRNQPTGQFRTVDATSQFE